MCRRVPRLRGLGDVVIVILPKYTVQVHHDHQEVADEECYGGLYGQYKREPETPQVAAWQGHPESECGVDDANERAYDAGGEY